MSTLEDYEVLSTIGRGSYGCCRKVKRRKDGRILVWKELFYGEMTETEKHLVVSEVNLLREFRHPNIVRYYDRIIDRPSEVIYIIMEYCEGGDLSSMIRRYKDRGQKRGADETFVWRCLTQLCSALRECHCRTVAGHAVLHRDLKPANVFLDRDNNIKLGDFGLARVLQHDNSFAKTFVGTPYYMSPEQMRRMAYNEKSDIWSLGCLIYELCALHPPFLAKNQRDLAMRVRRGTYAQLPGVYSGQLRSVVDCMLQVDDAKRPDIQALYQTVMAENPCRSSKSSNNEELTSSRCPVCKTPTLNSDSDSTDSQRERMSKLKRREEEVQQKEQEIKKGLLDLTKREKAVSLIEKVADDKMKKADSLIKEYEQRLREISIKKCGNVEVPSRSGDAVLSQNRRGGTAPPAMGDFSPIGSPTSSPLWYRTPDNVLTPRQSCLKKETSPVESQRHVTPRKTVTFLASGIGPCPLGLSPTSLPTSCRKSNNSVDSQSLHCEEPDENKDPQEEYEMVSGNSTGSYDSERRSALQQRWERARVRSEMLKKLENEIMERCQTVLKLSSESS